MKNVKIFSGAGNNPDGAVQKQVDDWTTRMNKEFPVGFRITGVSTAIGPYQNNQMMALTVVYSTNG